MMKRFAAAMLVCGLMAGGAVAAPAVGDKGPEFTLRDLGGKSHTLTSLAESGKAVVLVWMSVDCPYSKAYDADYEAVAKDLKRRDVVMVGIFSNKTEPADKVKAYAEQQGWTFPVLLDPGNKVADSYGATRTPEVRVLNPSKVIKYSGAWTNNRDPKQVSEHYTKNAAIAVAAGRDPNPSTTRAFGCTIKR